MSLLSVFLLTVATSVFSAIAGVGGGPLLLACLPFFLPPAAVIPVHGVIRLSANVSRAWFGRRHLLLAPLRQYVLGTLCGIACGILLLDRLPAEHIPLFIACYILLNLWVPAFQRLFAPVEHFTLIGFIQTLLSVFTGGSDPMDITVLQKRYHDHHAIVSTSAAMMILSNAAKVVTYAAYGFSFAGYAWLLAAWIAAAVIGTWLGVRLRHRLRAQWLRPMLKYVLTALALWTLVRYWQG